MIAFAFSWSPDLHLRFQDTCQLSLVFPQGPLLLLTNPLLWPDRAHRLGLLTVPPLVFCAPPEMPFHPLWLASPALLLGHFLLIS